MSQLDFSVPEDVSFEQAIGLTQSLLAELEQGTLSDEETEQIVAALVCSQNGARGFFVSYLTDDRTLADTPSQAVLHALQSSPDIVTDLLVKNLAMSTAMILAHQRSQDLEMAAGSKRVQVRSQNLMRSLQLSTLHQEIEQLLESVVTGQGEYQEFLKHWGYDAEQKQAIATAFQQLLEHPEDSSQD